MIVQLCGFYFTCGGTLNPKPQTLFVSYQGRHAPDKSEALCLTPSGPLCTPQPKPYLNLISHTFFLLLISLVIRG